MNARPEIESQLKSIIDYVQDCERRVMKGEIMDLQGLDSKVIEICDTIADLPPEQGRVLEDEMARLIEKLETLAQSMKEQQGHVSARGGR